MTLSKLPRRRLALVTCMDCRIDPLDAAGLEPGDAHVIRNAGAVVTTDVSRSLALSQRALGTEEVWIVKHTDCGLLGLDDREFLDAVEAETGERPGWTPGGFDSLEEGVREAVEQVRSDPALASSAVRGFILDVEGGELMEIGPNAR
ncbi:MAG TPA: carbonic anhydrase [Solirubrobacterales bacterium]|jgi:carbonic anhydrase|nr:carbonic anhydrase [Solirubrobacterales bacterium]